MIEIVIIKHFEVSGGMKSNTLTLDVLPEYSVLQVKTLIRTMWPVPVSQQRLKLKNKHSKIKKKKPIKHKHKKQLG